MYQVALTSSYMTMNKRKISDRWFKEDREKYKGEELEEQKAKTEKLVRSQTVFARRLKRILNEDLEKTFVVEEDFDDPAWQRKTIAAAAERKTLRRIIKLIP